MEFTIDRFRQAQDESYATALTEIRSGKKQSHWIWYIFPQLRGLGHSATAQYYEIQSVEEAIEYWKAPALSAHLVEISKALLKLNAPIDQIMGYPDDLKVRSCMTLFWLITEEQVFKDVLDKFFGGSLDDYTIGKIPQCQTNAFGMKIRKVREPSLELPFCDNTMDRDMELWQFINKSGAPLIITVTGTLLRYNVPKDGKLYCVCCEDRFVQAFRNIKCSNNEIKINTGRYDYVFTDEKTSCKEITCEPICTGFLGLDHDGAALVGGYRFAVSEYRNPVVYADDGAGVDSKGLLLLMREEKRRYQQNFRCISASRSGELCITGDRRILCRGNRTLEEGDAAIRIATCDYGYLVLTQCGNVFFSSNGTGWQRIGEKANAIAADGDLVAWADIEGKLFIYQHGEHALGCAAVLRFPGRYIEGMDISSQYATVRFLDGSFDILNWHTGNSEIGIKFISPKINSD